MLRCLLRLLGMSFLVLVGCDEPPPSATNLNSSSTRSAAPPPPPPGGNQVAPEANAPTGDENLADNEPPDREVAKAGVGKKGRNYGGGIITEPIKQYFRQGQQIHFMNMQHAMRLYKAEHGSLPQSHEAFMKDIIEANGIELPELPEGEKYVFDPQRGELMVERPKSP